MYDNCKENMSVGNVSESVGKLEAIVLWKNPIMTFTVVEKYYTPNVGILMWSSFHLGWNLWCSLVDKTLMSASVWALCKLKSKVQQLLVLVS